MRAITAGVYFHVYSRPKHSRAEQEGKAQRHPMALVEQPVQAGLSRSGVQACLCLVAECQASN